MMASVGAQMLNAAVDIGGGEVPDGALFHIDFENNYYWNGTNFVAASAVIDIPEQITANGLEIEDVEANILGDFLTILIAMDWTIVVEYDHTFDAGSTLPWSITDDFGVYYIEIIRQQPGGTLRKMLADENGVSEYREVIDTDSHELGIHKIALTRTDAKLVISVDGDPIVSDTSAMDIPAMTKSCFGGFPGFGTNQWCTIKRMTAYAAQDDTNLPALSAL